MHEKKIWEQVSKFDVQKTQDSARLSIKIYLFESCSLVGNLFCNSLQVKPPLLKGQHKIISPNKPRSDAYSNERPVCLLSNKQYANLTKKPSELSGFHNHLSSTSCWMVTEQRIFWISNRTPSSYKKSCLNQVQVQHQESSIQFVLLFPLYQLKSDKAEGKYL